MAVPLPREYQTLPPGRATARLVGRIRESLEDASAVFCRERERRADLKALLWDIKRLSLLGIKFSQDNDCPCWRRHHAALQDVTAALATYERDDEAFYDRDLGAWALIKRAVHWFAKLFPGAPS